MINDETYPPGSGRAYVIRHRLAGLWAGRDNDTRKSLTDWTPEVERAHKYNRQIGQLAIDVYVHGDDRHNLSLEEIEMDSEGRWTSIKESSNG
jgi:hypothetical protein